MPPKKRSKSLPLQCVKAVPQQIHAQMMEQSRELSCFFALATCRTPFNPWDTRAPLCVGLVWDCAMFSLVHALPSPASVEDCSPLFGRFIGTTAQSDFSRTCVSALWFITLADRSRSWLVRDVLEISRFSCMLFLSVRGFFDYAGPTGHSRFIAVRRVAFPRSGRSQHPYPYL